MRLLACVFALCILLFGSCGSAGGGFVEGEGADRGGGSEGGANAQNEGRPAFALDVAALGERLYQEIDYRDRLEELDPAIVYALLGIDGDHVADQKNYFSSGATAEEIIVLKAKDAEAAKALRFALETRLEDQKDVYASYAPEEVSYLKDAVLEEKGGYLVFCVSADSEGAKKLVADVFAEK